MITIEQRKTIGEKLLDLANISAGALVFGSLISGEEIKWYLVVLGIFMWSTLVLIYFQVTKIKE